MSCTQGLLSVLRSQKPVQNICFHSSSQPRGQHAVPPPWCSRAKVVCFRNKHTGINVLITAVNKLGVSLVLSLWFLVALPHCLLVWSCRWVFQFQKRFNSKSLPIRVLRSLSDAAQRLFRSTIERFLDFHHSEMFAQLALPVRCCFIAHRSINDASLQAPPA